MTCKTLIAGGVLALLAAPALADDRPAALIIAQGGLGDGAWNDSGYAGFEAALKETGLKGRAIESNDVVGQGEQIMRRAADAGFGLIASLEWSHGETMGEIAPDYPDTDWVMVGQSIAGDNIASVLFGENEASYLAGMLAAEVTTDDSIEGINPQPIIGVIGAIKSPGIDKFIVGYIQGAHAANPDVQVKVAYSETFGDPAKGEQMAKAMFQEGADIVYQVAGGTGIGVIEAAESTGHFAIGVDTDQDDMAPGHVLTSVVKRVDVAVGEMVKAYAADEFPGGETRMFGLAQNGVGLTDMKYTADLIPAEYIDAVNKAKQEIIDGKIKVWDVIDQGYPDFFK